MATTIDSFTRADDTDLGTTWDAGYTGFGVVHLNTNAARASAANGTDCVESSTAITPANDQFAQITLTTMTGTLDLSSAGVILRAADPATVTWYWVYAETGTAGGSAIAKESGGSFSILTSEGAVTWAAGDVLVGAVRGSVVMAFRNGTALLTTTDSGIASGRVGLSIKVQSGGSVANVIVDTFKAGDLSTTTIRPLADGTTTGWTRVAASGTFAAKIVDDPDANDGDTSYVMAPNLTDSSMWVTLDATPSDFELGVAADLKASAKKVEAGVVTGADLTNLFLQLERTDESTDITAESTVCNVTVTASYTLFTRTVAVSGTHTKTNWDAARLKLRQDYTLTGMVDTTAQIRVTAAEVIVAYVPIVSEAVGRTSKNTHPWPLGINLGMGIGMPA